LANIILPFIIFICYKKTGICDILSGSLNQKSCVFKMFSEKKNNGLTVILERSFLCLKN